MDGREQQADVQEIADYKFVRWLGEGNHGNFYLAETPTRLQLDVGLVVVKVLDGATSNDGFRRATRELRVFASIDSPYLVTLFDAGQDGNSFFYAMEYFPMGSLASPSRPIEPPGVLRALTDAARAAHALHESGVAHRDIKPANIELHEGGAKLSDLGMAQLLTPGLTVTGMGPIGSVEFIDPLLIRGGRASRATDIWSLGTVTHRAITGRGVYGELPSDDPLLALRRVLSATPALDPSLSAPEAELVSSCLAPDPGDRPPTAEDVAKRLEELDAL
jgi:eukaryotic-like serine/threonine-protein kinase